MSERTKVFKPEYATITDDGGGHIDVKVRCDDGSEVGISGPKTELAMWLAAEMYVSALNLDRIAALEQERDILREKDRWAEAFSGSVDQILCMATEYCQQRDALAAMHEAHKYIDADREQMRARIKSLETELAAARNQNTRAPSPVIAAAVKRCDEILKRDYVGKSSHEMLTASDAARELRAILLEKAT